jgi:hypothetical protein
VSRASAVSAEAWLLRRTPDAWLLLLSCVHAGLLLTTPSIPLVAIGLWWNANTIAHNFIHQPFFRSRAINHACSAFLSVVLGFPQSIWRQRHLAHHGGRPARIRTSRLLILETVLVSGVWTVAATLSPRIFFLTYLPGWALGFALCSLQGHYEHARGTTSHYGWLYNALFFNDGYHIEHHEHPGVHWTDIRHTPHAGSRRRRASRYSESGVALARAATFAPCATAPADPACETRHTSRWPPILRWLDDVSLDGLERLVLIVPLFQRVVVSIHLQAFRRVLPADACIRSVLIVGGGLFPRTALVLRTLLPEASLTIIDANEEHLAAARRFLDDDVVLTRAWFTGVVPPGVDLAVVPLAYVGDRGQLYSAPPARLTLVHDWLWHKRGTSAVVSRLLLKRVNVVVRPPADGRRGERASATGLVVRPPRLRVSA